MRRCSCGEFPYESERGLRDLTPAAVDREGVASSDDLHDLCDALVALLLLVRRVRNRPRNGVVDIAGDDEHRAAVGTLRLDLRFRPRVEVRGRGLEQRLPPARGGGGPRESPSP